MLKIRNQKITYAANELNEEQKKEMRKALFTIAEKYNLSSVDIVNFMLEWSREFFKPTSPIAIKIKEAEIIWYSKLRIKRLPNEA